jgi:DNA-binding transcriptional LysR family regulator
MDGALAQVLRGDAQVSLTVEPVAAPDLMIEEICRGSMGFYASAELRMEPILRMSEAKRIPLFTNPSAHLSQYVSISSFLAQLGFDPGTMHELESLAAAAELAAMGLGLAFLPDRVARDSLRSGGLRPVAIQELESPGFGGYRICASYLAETSTNPAALALVESLRESAATAI